MIAIQADEHIPQEVVTGLNARGIEAYSAYHEGLSGGYRIGRCSNTRSGRIASS